MGRPRLAVTKKPRRKPKPPDPPARHKNRRALQNTLLGYPPDINKKKLTGKMIRGLRQVLGLTQVALAAQLGTAALTVSQWEIGRVHPGRRIANKLRTLANANDLDIYRMDESEYVKERVGVRVFVETQKVAQGEIA